MEVTTCLNCNKLVKINNVLEILNPDFKNPYTIFECPNCKIKKTWPIPGDLSSLYSPQIFNAPDNKLKYCFKKILNYWEIKRFIHYAKSREFLDVGAGFGEFSEVLYKMGYSVHSVDAFQERPYYIKSIPEIPYHQFNYETIEIQDPHIIKNKVVILRHVLEHIKNPHQFLQKFILNGASHFYIVVPNADSLEMKIFRQYAVLWAVPHHLWHFGRDSLKTLLTQLGLEIVILGYDTIPTIMFNIRQYFLSKKSLRLLNKILPQDSISYILSMPLNLFFPNNVVWVIAKVNKNANRKY